MTGEVGASIDIGENVTVQASAFKAEETGEYGDGLWRRGDGELALYVGNKAWICDSSASTRMTTSADHMINYRKCNLKLRIANGTTRSIEGYGDINFVFRSGNGLVDVLSCGRAVDWRCARAEPPLPFIFPAQSHEERSRF